MSKSSYVIAFFEGALVMALELCGAKLLAPIFGTSLVVWSAVLSMTLLALMLGYFLGGELSQKKKTGTYLSYLIVFATAYTFIISWLGPYFLNQIQFLDGRIGAIIGIGIVVFFPLIACGAISPLIIERVGEQTNEIGKSSGRIYAVSTLGGILSTFLIGYYFLPYIGTSWTLRIFASLLFLMLFFLRPISKKGIAIVFLIGVFSFTNKRNKESNILYQNEGVLGKVEVVERVIEKEGEEKRYRQLLVNNIGQTMIDIAAPEKSYWPYVAVIKKVLGQKKQTSDILLLGLGGGTVYKNIQNKNRNITVVEVDERIAEVAKKFFFVDDRQEIKVEDARVVMRKGGVNDVILFDLFLAEAPPEHLMTKEAFALAWNRLNEKGWLLINFYGNYTGNQGVALRNIVKTLQSVGYSVQGVLSGEKENESNMILIASKEESSLNEVDALHWDVEMVRTSKVYTDNRTSLSIDILPVAARWRAGYVHWNQSFIK